MGFLVRSVITVFLVMGLLIGCESTGRHVSTSASEDITSGEIIPPVISEEEVFEPDVEEIEVASSIEEAIAPVVESTEAVAQDGEKDSALPKQHSQEIRKAAVSSPSPPKAPLSLPTGQAPVSVESPKIDVAEPVQPKILKDIYFDFDQAEILDVNKPVLEANAALLKGHFKHLNVLIEGHCDERGSVEYNLVLGVRRAQVVKAYLIDLGIPTSRIRIVSFGKERPVCTLQHDSCWQKNRRVHFLLQ